MDQLPIPPVVANAIVSYRLVYLLCTVNKTNKQLRATHYVIMLQGGRSPTWAVWTINGVFQRFFPMRSAVEAAYPRHVWRKRHGTWGLLDVHTKDHDEREEQLHDLYRRGGKLSGEEFRQVLPEPEPLGENVVRFKGNGI